MKNRAQRHTNKNLTSWFIFTVLLLFPIRIRNDRRNTYPPCWRETGKVNVNVAPLPSGLFFAHILPP